MMGRWSTATSSTSLPASRGHSTSGLPATWKHVFASTGTYGGFTSEYKVNRLVYYEQFQWVDVAIGREKQLKRWRREKKITLIERENPTWEDLSAEWGKPARMRIRVPAK
jgi:predicted GIY-YIG superfamily endonuclease